MLGVQLVIDGILWRESPRPGVREPDTAPGLRAPLLCPGGLAQPGQDSFAYICIALLFGPVRLRSCPRLHWQGGGWNWLPWGTGCSMGLAWSRGVSVEVG